MQKKSGEKSTDLVSVGSVDLSPLWSQRVPSIKAYVVTNEPQSWLKILFSHNRKV